MDDFKLQVIGFAGVVGFCVWIGEKIIADSVKLVRSSKRLFRELKK
jgi:hypothetical protein